MYKKAFTLIELLLASILAMALMTASVGVLELMHRESNRFSLQVDNDMNWVTANTHLARTVRTSSYLEVSDINTLQLYNFDDTLKGTYTSGAGQITYTPARGGTASTFRNVDAVFSIVSDRKSEDGTKDLEVRIDYTEPFNNMLCLRCAVGVAAPLVPHTWAIVINLQDSMWPNNAASIIQASDLSYVVVGSKYLESYLAKISNDGSQITWSKFYSMPGFWNQAMSVNETFNNLGVGTGFVIGGASYNSSGPTWAPFMITTDTNGIPVGNSMVYPSMGSVNFSSVIQLFDKNVGGNPAGYLAASGRTSTWNSGGSAHETKLWRLNTDGTVAWGRRIEFNPTVRAGAIRSAKQVFTASGAANGYIVAGQIRTDGSLDYDNKAFIMRLTDPGFTNPDYEWSYIYSPVPATDTIVALDAYSVYDINGEPDGFIIGGQITRSVELLNDIFLLRTNGYGSRIWLNKDAGFFWNTWKIPEGFMRVKNLYTLPYIVAPPAINAFTINDSGSSVRNIIFGYIPVLTRAGVSRPNVIIPSMNSRNECDGYVVLGPYAGGVNKICIAKTDLNGRCPEAADPELKNDVPDVIEVNLVETGSAFSDINMDGNSNNDTADVN